MQEGRTTQVQAQIQCVTFTLEDETYGIDVMQVKEVLREIEVAPVPGAPHYVIGIINLRGNVVSIIDARKLFGLPPMESSDLTRIIVIEVKHYIVGFLVDSVAEVVDIKTDEIEAAPNVGTDETSSYIDGVVSRGDEILILVDLNKLLSAEEWGEVEGL